MESETAPENKTNKPDLIIKSKIKSAVPDMSVAAEVGPALNDKVLKILEEATQRAKANGRRTLQARDL
jgi:histone H3/H4